MKSLFIAIALLFVSLFATAQTATGKFKTVKGIQHEVFIGNGGGVYYLNDNGNKTYITGAEKADFLNGATVAQVASIKAPTAQQIEIAKTVQKESVLQIFEKHVIFHGVKLNIEFGAPRAGKIAKKFYYLDANNELKTRYITDEYNAKFPN